MDQGGSKELTEDTGENRETREDSSQYFHLEDCNAQRRTSQGDRAMYKVPQTSGQHVSQIRQGIIQGTESVTIQEHFKISINVESSDGLQRAKKIVSFDEQVREQGLSETEDQCISQDDKVGDLDCQIQVNVLVKIKKMQDIFKWNNFWYNLFLNLIPSAWDMISDFMFGLSLEESDKEETAGICYGFIILPIYYQIFLYTMNKVIEMASAFRKIAAIFLFGMVLPLVFASAYMMDPLVFKIPAFLITVMISLAKTVPVFVHHAQVKLLTLITLILILILILTLTTLSKNMFETFAQVEKLSGQLSQAECVGESSFQLLLILHVWLTGGPLYLSTIFSSVLVIGKVHAESFLGNLLKDQTFLQKLGLMGQLIPVMTLTALFRIGSVALLVSHQNLFHSSSPAVYICQIWTYLFLCNCVVVLTLAALRSRSEELGKLTLVQMFQGERALFVLVIVLTLPQLIEFAVVLSSAGSSV